MKRQRGNILFLILLAVILFAALSYAVTSSMRGGGNNASSESAEAAGSAIVQFLIDIETFITRARMIDDTSADTFTFQTHFTWSDSLYRFNNNSVNCWNMNSACSLNKCRVFKPWNPNGIAAQTFEQYADSTYVNDPSNTGYNKGGHLSLNQLIIQNVGTSAPDLVAVVWGVTPDICNAINRRFGISTNYTNATTIDSIGETAAQSRPDVLNISSCGMGPITYNSTRIFGDQATIFAGQRTFCAPLNNPSAVGSKLGVLHVLIER